MAESQATPPIRQSPFNRRLLALSALPLGVFALGAIAAVLALLGLFSVQVWDTTNSSAFCIDACHDVHPEEAFAYQDSFHARVTCTECHIGRIGTLREIARKTTHARHLSAVLLDRYERPLASGSMRPANETCERCHSPSAMHDDTVRDIQRFLPDWDNTAKRTRLVLKTARGTGESGPDDGIHWHITNRIEYIATDSQKQDIPWVRVTYADGRIVEYNDLLGPLTPEEITRAEKKVMDCVDCHNRVGHPFPNPEDLVDQAMADGRLSAELPFVKKEVLSLVSAEYASREEALRAAGSLVQRYEVAYPKVSLTQRPALEDAVLVTRELITRLVFESPGVTWRSFVDNSGHKDFAGCFRCHDGNHAGPAGQSIALTCTTCHSVPVTVDAGDPLPDPAGITLDEPLSHQAPTFLVDHRLLANPACGSCHGEISFGRDDSSFCANAACHGSVWPNLDLDSASRHPVPLEGEHAEVTCNACHNGESDLGSSCANCHQPPLQPHFGTTCEACHTVQGFGLAALGGSEHWAAQDDPHALLDCTRCHADRPALAGECAACHAPPVSHPAGDCVDCHTPAAWSELGAIAGAGAPPVPHDLSVAGGCFVCHDPVSGVRPAPPGHGSFADGQCLSCHTAADAVSGSLVSLTHDERAFPLLGRHATVECTQCHTQGIQVSPPRDCGSCHGGDAHQGRYGLDCARCHSSDGWNKTTFDHAQTSFILRGKHQSAACAECHVAAPAESTARACIACHQADEPHAGQFGETCGQCHDAGSWQNASFDHASTGWKLAGSHAPVTCEACHVAGSNRLPQGNCSACHQDKGVHNGQFGQDCARCHTPGSWQNSTFDHAQTGAALTGRHTQVTCLACHANSRQVAGLQSCVSCHQEDDVHAGRFGQTCDQCHSPAGWQRASLDHALVDFPLQGAHVQVECQQCHAGNVYQGTPKRCNACHGEPAVHAGLFGTACANCHTADSWAGASYAQNHTFPLDHRSSGSNTCQTCHPNGLETYTCYNCHEHQPDKIEREHREEAVGSIANCVDCHPNGRKPKDD